MAEAMEGLLNAVGDKIVYVIMGVCLIAYLTLRSITLIVTNGGPRERSRREIAAYIAEGSMTAEQGDRLLRAGTEEVDEDL